MLLPADIQKAALALSQLLGVTYADAWVKQEQCTVAAASCLPPMLESLLTSLCCSICFAGSLLPGGAAAAVSLAGRQSPTAVPAAGCACGYGYKMKYATTRKHGTASPCWDIRVAMGGCISVSAPVEPSGGRWGMLGTRKRRPQRGTAAEGNSNRFRITHRQPR